MNAFEFNKIAGAVLAALLLVFGMRTVMDTVTMHPPLKKPGYDIKVSSKTSKPGEEKPAVVMPIAQLLKLGNLDEGKSTFKKQCTQCHSDEKGVTKPTGPALHGVLGRDIGSIAGFDYSPAVKGKGGKWTYELLQCYVADPKKCIPDNKMAFKGLSDDAELASVILYLRSLADSPMPLPQ